MLESFGKGFGTTAAGVGILIALGAMFAKLLADSGGADEIVDTIVGHASPRALPWAMALVGAIIGLPMFFEIGLVLLMPVIYLVARRSQLSLITVGIPALAGLSAMHGLVPPHPGPLVAIGQLERRPRHHAGPRRGGRDPDRDRRRPAVRQARRALGRAAGPGHVLRRRVRPGRRPAKFAGTPPHKGGDGPSFGVTMLTVLLPVVLMMGKALVDIFIDDESQLRAGLRLPRHPADRAADRRRRRDVHPRPRRRA